MAEAEKSSLASHQTMVGLEQTIRDLRRQTEEQKKSQAKSKQTERLNEAADKIDELLHANANLATQKDKA